MTFIVSYRGTDGAVRSETVDAPSRAACLAQIHSRGISPISIVEDGSAVAQRPFKGRGVKYFAKHKSASKRFGLLLAGGIAIVVVGCFWLWIASRGHADNNKQRMPTTAISQPKPHTGKSPLDPEPKDESPKYVPTPLPADWDVMTKQERAEWRKEDAVNNPKPPQPAPTTFSASSLRRKKDAPPPVFNNQIHSDLANYIVPGHDIPPPGRISDAEALEAANIEIVFYDTDSDSVREEKQTVVDMLQEMKEYIEQGGHANDYFEKLAQRQSLEAEAVTEARRNVRALIREGRIEDAKEALDTYNAYLNTKGVPPIRVKGLK